MKKIIIFGLVISLLLVSSCNKDTGLFLSESDVSSRPYIAVRSYETFDIWNYTSPTSDNPMAICNIFPDPYFALEVAGSLGKKVTDAVTYEELADYNGEIYCSPSPLKSIEGIGLLKNITSFGSAKNELEIIPAEFGNLTEITSIDLLKSYGIRRIPEEIGNLKKLEFFRIDLTSLEELPKGIDGCESLRVLNISNTDIKTLPVEIGNLKNLEFLDIHSNDIENIPDSICNLTKLVSLDIGYTKLKSLPENIGNLTELVRLKLFGGQLKILPSSVKNLKKLRYLNVYDNFDLDEDYKKWFNEKVYTCKDDPDNDKGWIDKWYYNR